MRSLDKLNNLVSFLKSRSKVYNKRLNTVRTKYNFQNTGSSSARTQQCVEGSTIMTINLSPGINELVGAVLVWFGAIVICVMRFQEFNKSEVI